MMHGATWHADSGQDRFEWLPFDQWVDELFMPIHRDPFGSLECGGVVPPRTVRL